MVPTVAGMTPFRIEIPQSDLDDLHDRLTRTRWAPQLPGDGRRRGVPVDDLRALAHYWRDGFDWRAQERRLNEFPQFTTEIDGQEIHFLHVRSGEPDAFPLVLTHGWPNSFVEFRDLIGPLVARGFDVVVPSVPGFGFSAPPREAGFSVERVAGLWAELMRRLGYTRYGTQGGDLGAYVAPAVAKADPEHVAGVYVIAGLGFPTEADVPEMTDAERAAFAEMQQQDWMSGVDHHALLRAAPQTFAYGWHDSPVAALAWMTQKFQEFSAAKEPLEEVLDRDALLTNVSVYWFTRTFGTSSWPMYDTTGFAWPEGQRTVPTGVFTGPPGIRRFAERTNRIIHWPEHNTSRHHFVAMEAPEAMAADMAAFFTKARAETNPA
ncbi:microsomal epoxide hydrolase [Actinoplanes sp. NBRC 103695]|nr:microsomal epoxide hydrolase [Actinoplanes sp. NBRC 103695]